ncbi:MAG: hypothetical protein AABW90_02605 [Nanoarchaeota archaeon]
MVMINIRKRDIGLITAIVVFVLTLGLVISFGDYRTGNPKVMGHSSDEIMVNSSGVEVTLQNYIDNSGLNIEIAQAFRKDGPANSRPIITVSGSKSAFVILDNKRPQNSSQFTPTTLDGIGCNGAQGWKIAGCWMVATGSGEDIYPYNNGCISKKYDNEDAEMSVACIKIS